MQAYNNKESSITVSDVNNSFPIFHTLLFERANINCRMPQFHWSEVAMKVMKTTLQCTQCKFAIRVLFLM